MSNDIKTCDAPTVSLLGLGGCGVNLVREIYKHTKDLVSFSNFLDCSDANRYEGEDVFIVANSHGGGKVRDTNLEEMKARIPQLDEKILGDADIYILVGSLAGATGGVMLPLLVKELHKKGKRVIVGLVSEAIDEKGTKNTKASLKSLMLLAEKQDIFLPTVLAHTDRSRQEADFYVISQLITIISVLRQPCYEVDKNDRLNWLNASKTVGLDSGLHMTYGISAKEDMSYIADLKDKSIIAESMLALGTRDETGKRTFAVSPVEHSRFSKDGILANSNNPVTGIIAETSATLSKIVDEIERKSNLFSTKAKSKVVDLKAKLFSDDEDLDDFI